MKNKTNTELEGLLHHQLGNKLGALVNDIDTLTKAINRFNLLDKEIYDNEKLHFDLRCDITFNSILKRIDKTIKNALHIPYNEQIQKELNQLEY